MRVGGGRSGDPWQRWLGDGPQQAGVRGGGAHKLGPLLCSLLPLGPCIMLRLRSTMPCPLPNSFHPTCPPHHNYVTLRCCPSTQLSAILQPLATHDAPPTFYRTNKFTGCFQAIVESYGVAKYREVGAGRGVVDGGGGP